MVISKEFFDYFKGFDSKKVAECVLNLNEFEKDVIMSIWGKNAKNVYNETAREIVLKIREQLIKDNYDLFKYKYLMTKYRIINKLDKMSKYAQLIETYDHFTTIAILSVLYLSKEINDEELFIFTGKNREDICEIIRRDSKTTYGVTHNRYDSILNKR